MCSEYRFRPATRDDAREIAELIQISSDGVAVVEWAEQANQQGVQPLEIAEEMYRNEKGNYSWRNCTIVEKDNRVAGMLLCFATPKGVKRDPKMRPTMDTLNVFAPYMYLEEPDSWYICGVALYPEHRGHGIGTNLMRLAEQQAKDKGIKKLSLVAFDQNEGSVRLYKRLGYKIVDWAPVIPHSLIKHTGKALLMVADIENDL